jgi:hypothetical protein
MATKVPSEQDTRALVGRAKVGEVGLAKSMKQPPRVEPAPRGEWAFHVRLQPPQRRRPYVQSYLDQGLVGAMIEPKGEVLVSRVTRPHMPEWSVISQLQIAKHDFELAFQRLRRESRDVLVQRALTGSASDFRTVPSLAEETGLPEEDVRAVVESSTIARKPWGRQGLDMFAPSSKPVSRQEILSAIRMFLAKRP